MKNYSRNSSRIGERRDWRSRFATAKKKGRGACVSFIIVTIYGIVTE